MSKEANVTINGKVLTHGQSMTLRVAVTDFLMYLAEPENMTALGPIGPLYQERAREVEKMLVEG